MPGLNSHACNIAESATMAAAAATSTHPDPIGLSIGEPAEPPPLAVLEALAEAARAGETRYGPAAGLPGLRDAIAIDQSTRVNPVTAENVLVTSGGKPALIDALRCLLDPGDEVLILAPYWPSFVQQVEWCDGLAVIVEHALHGTAIDVDPIRSACTDRTRAIIVNSPNNPTAEVLSIEALRDLAELCRERDLWMLSDEVYRALAFDAPAPGLLDVEGSLERTVVVMSFSKRFSMTGVRVGAAIAAPETIAAMTRLTMASHTHTSRISQSGALAALELDGEWERKRLREYRRKRDLAVTQLSAIDGVTCASPDGAMYVFPQFTDCLRAKGVADDLQACRELREREGLSVVAGSVFGAPGALRLSYGVEDDRLEAALARIGRWASH